MKVVEYGRENNRVAMLLHGGGLGPWSFRAVAELLQDDFHVIVPVLDGHAGSDDGFVSIRATASSKGEVVGKFKNGPRPAYVLGQQEQWLEIYYDGVRGFVYEKYTTLEPTVEVTVNVDGDWLEGIYGFNGYIAYLIFDNGTYTYEQQYGTICMGKYRLEGNEIVLTPVLHLMPDLPCEVERHPINVAEKTLGGMGRSAFGVIDPNDEEGDMGEFMITSETFYATKKLVKSRLGM